MNPLSAITGGLQAISGLATAIPAAMQTRQSSRNKEEIDKLLRREEMGILGMSPGEEQQYAADLQRQADASRRASQRQAETALGAFANQGAGAALAQQVAAQEAQAATQSAIASEVAKAKEIKAQEQRQELEDRLAAEAERQQTTASIFTGGMADSAEFAAESLNLAGLTEGFGSGGGPDKDMMNAIAKRRGESADFSSLWDI